MAAAPAPALAPDAAALQLQVLHPLVLGSECRAYAYMHMHMLEGVGPLGAWIRMWFGYSPQLVFLLICIRNSWLYRKVLSPDLWFTQNELAIRTFIIDIEHVGDRTYHTLMRSIHEYNLQNSPFTCLNAAVTPAGGYHMILLYKGQKSVRLLFRDSDGYLVAVEDDLGSWYRFKDIPELPFINSAEMKMESGYGDMETSEWFVSKRFKVFMDLEFPSDLWKLVHNWGLVSN
uniref:Uncharacterized protein n=2 Tax=Oryza barthii TaxID=65489 RepID=A0A0D3HN26_9ORYZ